MGDTSRALHVCVISPATLLDGIRTGFLDGRLVGRLDLSVRREERSPGCAASIEMACPRSVCFLFSISLMLDVLLVVNNNEGRDRFYFSRHCIVQIDIDGDSLGDL